MIYTDERIQHFYDNGKVIEQGYFFETINMSEKAYSFHPKNSRLLLKNDDYFCGLRANTFVIVEGFCEWDNYDVILIIANHKGVLSYVMIEGDIIEPKDEWWTVSD